MLGNTLLGLTIWWLNLARPSRKATSSTTPMCKNVFNSVGKPVFGDPATCSFDRAQFGLVGKMIVILCFAHLSKSKSSIVYGKKSSVLGAEWQSILRIKTLEFLKYLRFFIVLANNVAAGSVSFIKKCTILLLNIIKDLEGCLAHLFKITVAKSIEEILQTWIILKNIFWGLLYSTLKP